MLKFLVRFLLCATCASILCGCEQGKTSTSSTDSNVPTHEPHILSWPLSAPVTNFDPVKATNIPEVTIIRQLFDTLVRLDKDLSLSPGIARKWEIDPTGREYTFHLKAGQVFHNGSPLTATDVKGSLERVAKAGRTTFIYKHLKIIEGYEAFIQGQAQEISGIQVITPLQIRIRLQRPHAPFLPALSICQAAIALVVDSSQMERSQQIIVGSGPFVLESADEQRITMRPFSRFIDGAPRIDRLVFNIYAGANVKKAAEDFLAGKLSAVPMPGAVEKMLQGRIAYKVIRRYMTGLFFYGFNMHKGSRLNADMRKQIAKVVDKRKLLMALHNDKALPADTIIPLGLAGHRHDGVDPARSRAHEAPQTMLKSIRMLSVAQNSVVEAEMAYLAERLHTLGIKLQVEYILDWDEFYKRLAIGDCDMFRLAWYPDTPDLDEMFFPLFHSQGEYNYFGYADAYVDALLEQARIVVSLEDRIKIYQQVEDYLLADLPAIPISYEALDRAVRPNVHGLDWNFLGEVYNSFASVWIE